jgi:hypothetical protein
LYPAAVVYACYYQNIKHDRSGALPEPMVRKLRLKLQSIGEIGSRVHRNLLGHCAEVRVSNQLLTGQPGISLNRIFFSNAIRPRTMQKIPMCPNCNLTF